MSLSPFIVHSFCEFSASCLVKPLWHSYLPCFCPLFLLLLRFYFQFFTIVFRVFGLSLSLVQLKKQSFSYILHVGPTLNQKSSGLVSIPDSGPDSCEMCQNPCYRFSSKLVCWVPLRSCEMRNWLPWSQELRLSAVVILWGESLWRWQHRGNVWCIWWNHTQSKMIWPEIGHE